ncbi:hypothetical protein JKP88DRAFT_337050 [Tribonema minus]|uniref:Cytochrome b5 heme-binding domain-containing protein n=1 Tax=Tribonema minus TaxID=303371 RepID=A0A835YLU2_9STRA|nr:hypothetical protein JKP88DRAFT_337050 [Tribonema minus]
MRAVIDAVHLAEAAFAPTPSTVSVLGELFTPVPSSTAVSALDGLSATILTAQLLKLKPADSLWHDHSNMLEDSRASSLSVVVARNRDALAASPPDPSASTENVTFPVEAFKPVQITIDTGATSSDAQARQIAFVPARQIAFVPGVYEIAWTIDKSNKTIAFDAAFTGMNGGYFALGMGTRMIGADIFAFCDFSGGSGNVNITDRVGTANALPVGDEWQAGGACANDVWLAKDGYVYDDKTKVHRVSFGRSLSAADACDTAIEDATQSIVWSFNPDAPNMQHEFTHRGIYSVNFYTGESAATPSSASPQTFFAFHGLVMLLAWGLCAPMAFYVARYKKLQVTWCWLAPMAFYVARYKKHWKNWIDIHELLASFAAEASLPIAIAAMTTAKGKFATTHGKIGLALFLAVILQFFSGLLRRAGITNRANKYFGTNYDKVHQFNKVFHRVFGRLVVLLGLLNVLVGLLVISPKDTQVQVSGLDTTGTDSLNIQVNWFSTIKAYVYPAVLSLWFVLFFAAEVHLRIGRRHAQKQVKRQLNVTTITMEQFNDRVLQGEKLLLVNDAVIDVHEYMKVHPGGSKVMKESIGCDVTKEVLGVRGMEQGLHKQAHKHSAKAWAAIQKLVVAYVDKEDEVLDYTDTPAALGSLSKGGSGFGGASTDPGSSMGGSVSSSSSSRRRAFGAEQAFVKFILSSSSSRRRAFGAEQAFVKFILRLKQQKKKQQKKLQQQMDVLTAEGWRPHCCSYVAFVEFILRSKRTLTNEKGAAVVSFVFEPKVKSRSLEALAPGYYHKFRVVHEGSVIQRSYTPVGQHQIRPGVLGFEYYIRLYPGGQMSAALAKLRVNDTVRAQGPFEIRELQQDIRHVFMIAGGTGITPMLQFVRCHVAKGVQLATDAGAKDADAEGDANDAGAQISAYAGAKDADAEREANDAAAATDPAHDQQLTVRAGSSAAVAQLPPGAGAAAAPLPPPQASAQQRALAKAQLGVAMMCSAVRARAATPPSVTMMHGMEELVPARTMALLWQTRSDVDGFCLSELQGIADASEMLRKADPSVGAHFYFTNYATKFVIASGIVSPGGRRHDTVAQHRAGRRRGSLMGRFKAAEDHAAAAAAATAAAAAAPAASVRAVAEDIEGGGGGDGGSGGGKGGSGDNGSGGGGGGEAEAGAAAASASAARKAWRTIAWVATGFEAHASTPRGSAAAVRHIADADAFDHGSGGGGGGGDAAGALPPRHGAAESGSSGGGNGTVKTAGRWCCGDVSAVETPPRRVSVSGTPPGAGATDAAAAPTPALEASSPRRGSVTTGLFPGRDGAQNQIIEGALSPAALQGQLAPLLEGLRRTGQLTTSEGAGSGSGGGALTPALAAADADTSDGGSGGGDGAAEWYNPRATRIIISGPPGFVDVVEQRLRDLGVPENVLCFLD